MNCPKCGEPVYDTDATCISCGAALRQPPPVRPQPTAPQQRAKPTRTRRPPMALERVLWPIVLLVILAPGVFFGMRFYASCTTFGKWSDHENGYMRIGLDAEGQGVFQLVQELSDSDAMAISPSWDELGARGADARWRGEIKLDGEPYLPKGLQSVIRSGGWPTLEPNPSFPPDREAESSLVFHNVKYQYLFPNRYRITTGTAGELTWTGIINKAAKVGGQLCVASGDVKGGVSFVVQRRGGELHATGDLNKTFVRK